MEHFRARLSCTLLLMSAIFTAARYISASVLTGVISPEDFPRAMEVLGPFLPAMATVCLLGGVVLLIVEAVLEYRGKNK